MQFIGILQNLISMIV